MEEGSKERGQCEKGHQRERAAKGEGSNCKGRGLGMRPHTHRAREKEVKGEGSKRGRVVGCAREDSAGEASAGEGKG